MVPVAKTRERDGRTGKERQQKTWGERRPGADDFVVFDHAGNSRSKSKHSLTDTK